MKRICVPIVNRTNYSKLKPVLRQFTSDVKVSIILSSSILLEQYGEAYKDIEKDGYDIVAKVNTVLMGDSLVNMSKSCSLAMLEYSSLYDQLKPDAVLITGDRFDMFAATISASFMNIPILHIQGGEKSGSIDDCIRDMISICATEHYVSTILAYEHVKNIAHSSRIFHTGCPAVEIIHNMDVGEYFDTNKLEKHFKDPINITPKDPYFLVMIHPNTVDLGDINMDIILQAIMPFNYKIILFYPNVDALYGPILSSIRRNPIRKKENLNILKHAPLHDFVMMMAHCSCMITNSSSGIREAASFGVPVINVGKRQMHREKNANVIDVMCESNILNFAIEQSLKKGRYPRDNIYYKEGAAKNIADLIFNFLKRK